MLVFFALTGLLEKKKLQGRLITKDNELDRTLDVVSFHT